MKKSRKCQLHCYKRFIYLNIIMLNCTKISECILYIDWEEWILKNIFSPKISFRLAACGSFSVLQEKSLLETVAPILKDQCSWNEYVKYNVSSLASSRFVFYLLCNLLMNRQPHLHSFGLLWFSRPYRTTIKIKIIWGQGKVERSMW